MAKHIVIDARNRRSSTGRYTDRLVEHLQDIDNDNRYTVLVEPGDSWKMRAKNFKTVPCRFKQFSLNPLDQILFAWQLYRLRANLVHFTMTQQPVFYFGRIVTTTHDLTMLRYARRGKLPAIVHEIRMAAYIFLFWWAHRKSAKIIVPTNFVAEDLAKYQPFTKRKTVVTYEAVGLPIKAKATRPKGVKRPFIFHLGSPLPHKNIKRLVKAFEILKDDKKDLQLVLAGKKEHYFAQLEEWVARREDKDSIIFTGFIPDGELKWLYENTEAYVLPSLSEGFGLPGLEAMAYKCPLVSSNATCLPEVYGKAAHYFDPKYVDDMAGAIKEVLGSKTLQEKLINSGQKQLQKYSWEKMSQETLDVYLDLI